MSERVIDIPRRLIILFIVVVLLVVGIVLTGSWMSNRDTYPVGTHVVKTALSSAQISETSTAEAVVEIYSMAETIARDIADGSTYINTGKYAATNDFIFFLDQIAKNMEESGLDPSTTFVRYEGEPLATIMTNEFAEVSVHVVYRDTALSPDALYLAEIEVYLVNDGDWQIDSILVQQKGGILP